MYKGGCGNQKEYGRLKKKKKEIKVDVNGLLYFGKFSEV